MALGPNPLEKEARLRKAEQIIDDVIRKSSGSDSVTVNTDVLPIRCGEWKLLGDKYKAAGWASAYWVSDQREGDFIQLKA